MPAASKAVCARKPQVEAGVFEALWRDGLLACDKHRRLVTLSGAVRLRLKVRRCERDDCACYRGP